MWNHTMVRVFISWLYHWYKTRTVFTGVGLVEEVPGRGGVSTGEGKAGCGQAWGHQNGPEFIPRPQKSREQKEVLLDSGLLEKAFSGLLNVGHLSVGYDPHISMFVSSGLGVGWGYSVNGFLGLFQKRGNFKNITTLSELKLRKAMGLPRLHPIPF